MKYNKIWYNNINKRAPVEGTPRTLPKFLEKQFFNLKTIAFGIYTWWYIQL